MERTTEAPRVKRCTKCGAIKPLTAFHRRGSSSDGRMSGCKICSQEKTYAWREANKDKWRAYTRSRYKPRAPRPKCPAEEVLRALIVKEKRRTAAREHEKSDAVKRYRKAYKKKHQRRATQRVIQRRKERFIENPLMRLCHMMGNRIRLVLREKKRRRSWKSFVPYTPDDLRRHIERQFTGTMSWDNFGSHWHVDHIVPISAFEFSSPYDREFSACWALSNLRPLEKGENLSKRHFRTHLI